MSQDKNMQKGKITLEEDEIDLIALVKTLWFGRKIVIKTILVFMGIGLFIAIFSEKEYTASTMIIPQTSDSEIGGRLGGLAAIAGINLGGMGSDSGISPELYPQILNSIPFQLELLQTRLTIEGQTKRITYEDYYTHVYSPGLLGYIKRYTIGLPRLLFNGIKEEPTLTFRSGEEGNNLLSISEEEKVLIKQLSSQVFLDVDDGSVTISGIMPEAIASAEMTIKVEKLLQDYVINFKIQKSKELLQFIEVRYKEKEDKFNKIQEKLAAFSDENKFVNTAMAQTRLERLQSEYDLAFEVCSELAKRLEAQQIQVTEDTPVFTVIKPVNVPLEKSKPQRVIILIIYTLLGVVLGIGYVFINKFVSKFKEEWNKY